mmetsp:Transcript_27830/g.38465  ORF Transcript_27830/g.38465 Transcript_27830/m.38465 type:complete len:277 (-) Transcript_27830:1058-1888(-)
MNHNDAAWRERVRQENRLRFKSFNNKPLNMGTPYIKESWDRSGMQRDVYNANKFSHYDADILDVGMGQERVQKPQRAQSAHPSRRPYKANDFIAEAYIPRTTSPPALESYEHTKARKMKDKLEHISSELAAGKAERRQMFDMMKQMQAKLSSKMVHQQLNGRVRPQSAKILTKSYVVDDEDEMDVITPPRSYPITPPDSPDSNSMYSKFRKSYQPSAKMNYIGQPLRRSYGTHRSHITHNRKNWSHFDAWAPDRRAKLDSHINESTPWQQNLCSYK